MRMLIEDLVESIKRRSFAVISEKAFTDNDIIALCNEEMQISLVPDLISVRENLFMRYKDVSLVANVPYYAIPERATGNSLKDLFTIDATGALQSDLNPTSITDRVGQGGTPDSFYLFGDEIALVPYPDQAGDSLRFFYFERPSELIATTSCSKISLISSLAGTTTFTVDTNLTGSISVGDKVDFLSGKSPFFLWAPDVSVTAITSSTIAVATTSVDSEAGSVEPIAGDYICPAQKANIPMIPQEFHPILSQMVVCRMLEALGHLDKMGAAKVTLAEMKINALKLIANRVESKVAKVNNKDSFMSLISSSISKVGTDQ